MRKLFAIIAIAGALAACNDSSETNTMNVDSLNNTSITTDTNTTKNMTISADTSVENIRMDTTSTE